MRLIRRPAAGSYHLLGLALFFLLSTSLAQNLPNLPDTNQASSAAATTGRGSQTGSPPSNRPATNSASASTRPPATPGSTRPSDDPAPTSETSGSRSEDAPESTSEDSNKPSETTSSSKEPEPTITPTGAVSTTQSAPRITGSGSAAPSLPKNLPTLSGAYSYPPPSVPPTAHAPFMQRSSLPEGTVFIVVGAALGFLAFSVLAWRGLVAWSVRRSVQRAARQLKKTTDTKVKLRPRGSGFYAAGAGSTLSLDHLSSNVRSSTLASKTGHHSSGNLFYSPTAHVSSGPDLTGARNSSYLPAGYYAAGTSTPGGGSGVTHLGTSQAYSYSRARSRGPSPPVSPSLSPGRGDSVGYSRPSHSAIPSQGSSSTLNLSAPPQGRAPSAYLEDLFESHQSHPGGQDRY